MYAILISNVQAGYPAHLAVENAAGTSGHNVVVDGYRESDGKFHLNFGWGGYKDNWYKLPDPNGFGYGWTKIEGLIVDLIPTASDVLCLRNLAGEAVEYAIYNVMGQKVKAGSTQGTIAVAELGKGVYLLQIEGGKDFGTAKFMVR